MESVEESYLCAGPHSAGRCTIRGGQFAEGAGFEEFVYLPPSDRNRSE